MSEQLERRLAANEVVFRQVNESIARGQWPGDGDAPIGFRCECARMGCNLLIELRRSEYERVRSRPRRFIVAPGHELPDLETVVERHAGYVVVAKRDEAAQVAEATDPRG